jgi:hypothetical protein
MAPLNTSAKSMKRRRKSLLPKERHKAISVYSGHLEGQWPGHFPVTSVAMMALLERAVAGEAKFSSAERVLFVACEFWSAFNAAELEGYFDLKAEDPTRDARIALRIIGAVKLADLLDRGVLGPAGGRAGIRRRRRLADLESVLRDAAGPMDLLLARFAWRYMSAERRTANPELRPPQLAPEARRGA